MTTRNSLDDLEDETPREAALATYSAASDVFGFYPTVGLAWGEAAPGRSTLTRRVYRNTGARMDGVLEFLDGRAVLRDPQLEDLQFIAALGATAAFERIRIQVLEGGCPIAVTSFRARTWMGPPLPPGEGSSLSARDLATRDRLTTEISGIHPMRARDVD